MLPRLQTQSQTSNGATAPQLVFRDPFTLKLRFGKGHDYRQQFDKVPYVAANVVYLFAGDKFGVSVSINGDEIQTLTYQNNPAKADVDFRFEQKDIRGRPMMLLIITSKLKRRLFMDAAMTVPEKGALQNQHSSSGTGAPRLRVVVAPHRSAGAQEFQVRGTGSSP